MTEIDKKPEDKEDIRLIINTESGEQFECTVPQETKMSNLVADFFEEQGFHQDSILGAQNKRYCIDLVDSENSDRTKRLRNDITVNEANLENGSIIKIRDEIVAGVFPTHVFSVEFIGIENIQKEFWQNLLSRRDTFEFLNSFFPYQYDNVAFKINFKELKPSSIQDYVYLLSSINYMYILFLTLINMKYFFQVWLKNEKLLIPIKDNITITRMSQNSPLNIEGTGVSEAIKAVSDTLSIGKQIEDIRKANINVEKARIELLEKKLKYNDGLRQSKIFDDVTDIEKEIEKEKRLLELSKLKAKREYVETQRNRIMYQQIEGKFNQLKKWINILNQLPDEMQSAFKSELFKCFNAIISTNFELESVKLISERDETIGR